MNTETPIRRKILCLDFDGVIHSYTSGWQGADIINDPPVLGAMDFIYEAVAHFEVHIFSSRSHLPGGIDAMKNAIQKWDDEKREAEEYQGFLSHLRPSQVH